MCKSKNINLAASLATTTLLIASGCTWVKPIEDASSVYLVGAANTQGCDRLGTTTSSVKDQIGWLNRSDERVASELLTLAQNSAVAMGGNTLVATAEPMGGSQHFVIYSCPEPDM